MNVYNASIGRGAKTNYYTPKISESMLRTIYMFKNEKFFSKFFESKPLGWETGITTM